MEGVSYAVSLKQILIQIFHPKEILPTRWHISQNRGIAHLHDSMKIEIKKISNFHMQYSISTLIKIDLPLNYLNKLALL